MNKVLICVTGILLVVAIVLGLAYSTTEKRAIAAEAQRDTAVQALDGVQKQRKIDAATLVANRALQASTARKLAEAQQGLSQALQRNSGWSDTEVPPDVFDALAGRSGGSNNAPR